MAASTDLHRTFRTQVFIATSLDGFIARPDGELDWLIQRGERAGDTGYDAFIAEIDTIVMGRNTYQKTQTFGFWPYEGIPVRVLSTQLDADDPNIIITRNTTELVRDLDEAGARNVYIDGGQLIQTFLRESLVDQVTITTAPVLLGSGLPLFGALDNDIELRHLSTTTLAEGFVQTTYTVPQV
ncbi:dihydrofolate reductase family protein [Rhodococcus sp. NBC_00297]|uniref:dihydrofolate reductase family protein n=1 Tax=Rhodococcus sp. NBC_00297 TaxID=2976005 RepID=UPI002E27D527|nr:dihydrofolate reductase family protein [Rhodococcus sp. NBC_00297]